MSVSLVKGSKISLNKEGGGSLSKVFLGLGWDVAKPKGFFAKLSAPESVDLDASCLVLDESKNVKDTVWFRQLKSKDGSIVHSGDNRTGEGDGDDEVITVDLTKLPAHAHHLVFTINSFTGQNFNSIENATCRIVDSITNKELGAYVLADKGSHNAQIMAVLSKVGSDWEFKAIGKSTSGRTIQDLVEEVVASI